MFDIGSYKSKSLYDVVVENLSKASRKVFLHRLIYISDHNFIPSNKIEEIFNENLKKVNEGYNAEILTGLVLFYNKYCIVMVEASEMTLFKHISYLLESHNEHFNRIKILGKFHHINQRYFNECGIRYAYPPTLLSKIDQKSNFDETYAHWKNCLSKLNSLYSLLQVKWEPDYDDDIEEIKIIIGSITSVVDEFLPENALIDFLLGSSLLYDLRTYFEKNQLNEFLFGFEEKVWPVHGVIIPYNIFDEKQELIPKLKNQSQISLKSDEKELEKNNKIN